ncbi:MAG: cryptochrome/photolyase family protein [Gammaproteobacteria bacterium]|nr:cryptochrome/photolyase family protein [Gammaproteobacteria bacterium]
MSCRDLILVLGDQLDRDAPYLDSIDAARDRVLMIESREESTRVWSHKARTALFLAAMRHHRDWLIEQGVGVDYVDINHADADSFATALRAALTRLKPRRLRLTEAGEYGVQQVIAESAAAAGVPCETLSDTHFLCDADAFRAWRGNRKTLVMEHFYRFMRKRHDVLMVDGKPAGERWNFDKDNRRAFGRDGPGMLPELPQFAADATTRAVFADVETHFADNPGTLQRFAWPVTREQALTMLDDFVSHRLAAFGPFQDAMWTDSAFLHHSALASALNLKLLNPREVIAAAESAAWDGRAPLQSVEGFVRQVLGWREYVRGIYWSEMPDYLERNALAADADLPRFYWTGETDMSCLRQAIGQTLALGYAHHIQRLMVTGLFALLLGVRPQQVHAWYLAVYVDAVEWVEAPNTLGMSQYADGGLLASKPYAASGRYIQRMSNYCRHCRYAPDKSTGDDACPFTTLYWDFLIRHEKPFARQPRTALQWRNLDRLDDAQRREIRDTADRLRVALADDTRMV